MIVAVSMIKNSADVIETMIRGNALVADRFVIIDNSSTDNTGRILNDLIAEGFKIDVLSDDNVSPYQRDRVQNAIRYALEKYHPDFILPVDDDEIVCSDSGSPKYDEVKAYIESLDDNNLYYMNWRNYIPTEEDDLGQICVALRERFCLDDEPEMTKKVLVPARIASSESFRIGWGSHFAECDDIREHVVLDEIRLAHYPIRSSVQIASKAIVGWINYLAMPNRNKDLSVHWQVMYRAIKEFGLPTADTMMTLSNLYRERPGDTENLNVACNPITIPDNVFELKYTGPAEINLLKNICENTERLAKAYAELLERTGDNS